MAKTSASEINDGEESTAADASRLVRRLKPGAATAKGAGAASFLIDSHFPGGNAIIESIANDVVRLRPDARDSEGGWFYWSVRVRGAAGKSLTFVFSEQDPVAVYGPTVSLDEGLNWQWLGNPDGSTDSFRCAFPPKALSVRLSFGINYTDVHWQRFCGRVSRHRTFVREEILCLSRKGRAVPRMHVGRIDGKAKYRMLLTARHHASETMANYAIEGIVLTMLTEDDVGRWFRENVELVVLPFMDRDGVEDGDQGKGRRPHDHCRDYGEDNLYPETRALREFASRWSEGRLQFMCDLHCPWIRGNRHEQIYQVAKLDPTLWAEQRYFGEMLMNAIRGPLAFRNVDDQHFGDEWRTTSGQTSGVCPADWFAKLPGMRMATSFEIPYANCSGARVTTEGVRAFGRDFTSAVRQYLTDAEEPADARETEAVEAPPDDDVPMAKIYRDPTDPNPPRAAPAAPAPSRSAPEKAPPAPVMPAAGKTPDRHAPLVPRGTVSGSGGGARIVIHSKAPSTSRILPGRSKS